MLSENQVVAVRSAIEKTYIGKCDIYEYKKVLNADKTTGFEEILILSNSCKLSSKSTEMAQEASGVTSKSKNIKLFIAPELNIKAGSKIVVTQNGRTDTYKNSGEPSVYATHQEITLELFEGWT